MISGEMLRSGPIAGDGRSARYRQPVLIENALDDPGVANLVFRQLAERHVDARENSLATLHDAYRRIDRAADHLAELRQVVDDWSATQEASVLQTDEGIVRVIQSGDPPPRLVNLVIGEAVQNLRTALDYLVYGLAWIGSLDHCEQTQFPITNDVKSFEKQRARLRGVNAAHVRRIREFQPFAGHEWLALLRDLSNQDKHWALTVAVAQGSVTATARGGPTFETEVECRILIANDVEMFTWLASAIDQVRSILDSMRPVFEHEVVLEFRGRRAIIRADPAGVRLPDQPEAEASA